MAGGVARGAIDGYVAESVRGKNGFGFDEIFELENGKTLAELTQQEKKSIKCKKNSIRINKKKNKKVKNIEKDK